MTCANVLVRTKVTFRTIPRLFRDYCHVSEDGCKKVMVKVRSCPRREGARGGLDAYLHTFLISALDGDE